MSLRVTLALGTAILSASSAYSQARGSRDQLGRWVFAERHLRGSELRDLTGNTKVKIVGRRRFLDLPAAMVFRDKSDRAVLARSLKSIRLPRHRFTVETWVAVDQARQWGGIFSAMQDNGSAEAGFLLGYRGAQFCLALATTGANDGDGKLTYLSGRSAFRLGHWAHVVGSYDGTTMRLYVDGELEAQSTAQSGKILYPSRATVEIGAYIDDNEHYPLQGLVSEVGLWSRALGADEVRTRYRAREPEFRAPPGADSTTAVADWVFDHDHVSPDQVRAVTGPTARIKGEAELRAAIQPHAVALGAATILADDPVHAGSPICVETTVWLGQPRARACVVGSFDTSGQANWRLGHANSHIRFDLRAGGSDLRSTTTTTAVMPFRWLHLIASYDGALTRIYVNGQLVGHSRAAIGPLHSSAGSQLHIGAEPTATGVEHNLGQVHQVRIYDHALDTTAVAERWAAIRALLPQPLSLALPPRLQYRDTRSATVRWRTRSATACNFEYLTSQHELKRLATAPGIDHEVRLGTLPAAEKLHFRILAQDPTGTWHSTPTNSIDTTFNYSPRGPSISADPPATAAAQAAIHILDRSGIRKGYCLVLDAGEGQLCRELAIRSELRVIGIEPDRDTANRARRAIAAAGLYGNRVTIHHIEGKGLPYTDMSANLIVGAAPVRGERCSVSIDEVERLLRPSGGFAVLGNPTGNRRVTRDLATWRSGKQHDHWQTSTEAGTWLWFRRPALHGAGEWTHQYGDLANSTCSDDQLVAGKLQVQWFGQPGPRPMLDRGCRAPAPLYADGRLIVQGDCKLFSLDAYNGTILWTLEIPALRRVNLPRDCSNQSLAGDALYVAIDDQVWLLDAQTGALRHSFALPEPDPDRRSQNRPAWGFVGTTDQLLLGTTTDHDAIYRDANGEWYDRTGAEAEAVLGRELFAYDRSNTNLRWSYRGGLIVHPTITVHRGTLYFVEDRNPAAESQRRARLVSQDGKHQFLVALDLQTGQPLWERQFDFRKCDQVFYLAASEDTVVALGTDGAYYLYGFDASSGVDLWQHQHKWKRDHHGGGMQHPVLVGQRIYAEMKALDLRSGEVVRDDLPERRGCGTMSAAARAIFYRHHNHGMWDLESDRRTQMPGIRAGCWLGMIPAGGLLLVPESSSGCSCAVPLQTSAAFRPVALAAEKKK